MKVTFKAVPKQVRAMPEGFYGNPHRHGCTQCSGQIHNCHCQTPERDPRCVTCKWGRRRPWWPESERPFDCCRVHAKPVPEAERNTQLLAGTRRWWRCEVCRRFQAHDPADLENDPPIELDEWEARFGALPAAPATTAGWSSSMKE